MIQKFGGAALLLLAAMLPASATPAAIAADSGWTILSLPTPAVAPNGQLLATSCVSPTACSAVGVAQDDSGRDVALAERWNGRRWQGQSTPRAATDVGSFLAGVSCTSVNMCTAVGNVVNGANQHATLAERWTGHDWQV